MFTLNPLEDPRWAELVQQHPAASIFHTTSWLEALKRTYAFEPVVYTSCPPGVPLTNGIALCRVRSWLTGPRMVSVPFADHCDPLVASDQDVRALAQQLERALGEGWRYIELRPRTSLRLPDGTLKPAAEYRLHVLDLTPALPEIFDRMHRSTIQRKILRAGREGLQYTERADEASLRDFYRLMVRTRRRHGLPPPPMAWLRNLTACFGERLKIRMAVRNGEAVAAVITLQHRDTVSYKYGASDERFHNLGVMPYLFWKIIEDSKARGMSGFDLGRSDVDNTGLAVFKTRLGGVSSGLTYVRLTRLDGKPRPPMRLPRWLSSRLPDALLIASGRALYRHMG